MASYIPLDKWLVLKIQITVRLCSLPCVWLANNVQALRAVFITTTVLVVQINLQHSLSIFAIMCNIKSAAAGDHEQVHQYTDAAKTPGYVGSTSSRNMGWQTEGV